MTEHIKDLVPDPKNRRKHNPRNIGMVVDALHQVGAARSIVIDEHNVVLAGNGVTEAAAEAGITKVKVVEADGNELVAVRRRGLTDEQKRALAIYDNRTGELAEWNPAQLEADAADGLEMRAFFTEDELSDILATDGGEARGSSQTGKLDQAIQLKPPREYIVVVCDEGEEGKKQFDALRERFKLGLVRRGGYKRGSAFDAVSVPRVVRASAVLEDK